MKEIIEKRLQSHFQWGEIKDIIQQLWCIQAQDTHQSPRVVASRCENIVYNDIIQAIKDKQLIRTRPMRGTLHYVDPRYVRIFLELCASKTLSWFQKRRAFLWISDQQAEQALDLFRTTLKGGTILTRSQIKQLLIDHNLCNEWQRVYHLTCYAGTLGIICFGPPTDKEDTFVLLDEWIPKTKEYTKEEGLTIIARLYFSGHGPATIDDLCWWTGLSKKEAKIGIEWLSSELNTIEFQSKIYYYIDKDVQAHDEDWTKLLWWFDEYFLGYKDRSIVADIKHHESLFTKNGIFFPLIIQDGKVIGKRKRQFKKDTCIITLSPLPGYTISKESVESQAKKYSTFRGYDQYEINFI